MDENLINFIMSLTGPYPHMLLFGTIGAAVAWFTREFTSTMLIMAVMSIGAECMQLAWPKYYDFEFIDIGWNLLGSFAGIILALTGRFLSSEVWLKREKDWDQIKGDVTRGNYTR